MNSKMLFVVMGLVVVGGGIFALKNLPTHTAVEDSTAADNRSSQGDEGAGEAGSASDGPRVGRLEIADTSNDRRPLSERTIRRGSSVATRDVAPLSTATAATAEENIPTPPPDLELDNRSVADLGTLFQNEADPDNRIDIAEQLGLIDTPESIKKVLELLRGETSPEVQEALLEAMQGLEAQEEMAEEIFKVVSEIYLKTDNDDVKVAAQDLMGDLATEPAAAGLKQVWGGGGDNLDYVKISAAENLMRIAQDEAGVVSAEERAAISTSLKDYYPKAADAGTRQQIIMALATEGKANAEFFQQMLATEQDNSNREMLQRLVRMFTAAPPAAPPPGTVVTPVPTLAPTP